MREREREREEGRKRRKRGREGRSDLEIMSRALPDVVRPAKTACMILKTQLGLRHQNNMHT